MNDTLQFDSTEKADTLSVPSISSPRYVLQHIVGTTQDQDHIENFLRFKTLLKTLQHRPHGGGLGDLVDGGGGVCFGVFLAGILGMSSFGAD